MTQTLGTIGVIIGIAAYMPQIYHLWKDQCASGVSLTSWVMWFVGGIFVLVHAFSGEDFVFKLVAVAGLLNNSITAILVWMYRNQVCEIHPTKKKSD
ncbi:PQ-loop repeat-containing protein [Candidatus Berkelbacteria bacterium]|nr:PQ-loop repeat-containing protein [Candidatus Berkelbacteria bacterium]